MKHDLLTENSTKKYILEKICSFKYMHNILNKMNNILLICSDKYIIINKIYYII